MSRAFSNKPDKSGRNRINLIVAIAFMIFLSFSPSTLLVNGQVSASVSLSSYLGSQGSVIQIYGKGFTAYDKVTLYFEKTVVGGAAVAADGSFTGSFTVPSTSEFVAGSYDVLAGDSKGVVGSAQFTITSSSSQSPASISVKPTSGPQGSNVSVQGSNFTSNDKVTIYLGKMVVGGAATAADGSFTASFTVPSTTDFVSGNSYTILAIDSQNLQSSSSFTISASQNASQQSPSTSQSGQPQNNPTFISPTPGVNIPTAPSGCSLDFSTVSITSPTPDQVFYNQNVTIAIQYHSSFTPERLYFTLTDHSSATPYSHDVLINTYPLLHSDDTVQMNVRGWMPQFTEADDLTVTAYLENSCGHTIASETIPYHSYAQTTSVPYHSWRIDFNQWISTHCRDAAAPTILNILAIPVKYSDDSRTVGMPMNFSSIQDRLEYISDYFYQQSMCHIRLHPHLITSSSTPDGWFTLPQSSNYYHSTIPPDPSNANMMEHAWIWSDGYNAALRDHYVLSGYDEIMVIHTGADRDQALITRGELDAGISTVRDICNAMSASGSCALDFSLPQYTHILEQPSDLVSASNDSTEAWAHELGHALFTFWDFYNTHEFTVRGLMGYWDIMANPNTNSPPPISLLNRERAGWLSYSDLPHDTRPVSLTPLSEMQYGGQVYTYELGDFFGPSSPRYIFELRNGLDNVPSAPEQSYADPSSQRTKDGNMLGSSGVEIYREFGAFVSRADTYLHPTCGSVDEISSVFIGALIHHGFDSCVFVTYNVMEYHNMDVAKNNPTLVAGQTYNDNFAGVEFTLNSDGRTLTVNHSPHSTTVVSLSSGTHGRPSGWFGSLFSDSSTPMLYADIQAYSSDGKHVGPNYQTGNYDVDIKGAEVGGALTPVQWISIPDNTTATYIIDGTSKIKSAQADGIASPVISAQVNIIHYDSNGARTVYAPINYTLTSDNPQTQQIKISVPQTQGPSGQSQQIPSWVRNAAKWWHENQISDDEFVKAMQYLIQQKIIQVPQTQSSSGQTHQIPSWVKNNAGWWSDGTIGDDEFIKGLQYMISNGIIQIS